MILDTNALSAYFDGVPEAIATVDAGPSVELPVIVLGEYRFGILQSRRRVLYEEWLSGFLLTTSVLPISEETTRHYADVRLELKAAGRPIPSNDIWVAALARQHRLPVLSRDTHFDRVPGLRRVQW